MATSFVREISAATFQQAVIERSMTVPVLLDFWAAWCGPCRVLGPVLERLAAEFGGGFELGKVDTEREPDLAYAFGVQGIPYCVLVDGGKPVDAMTGAVPEAEVRAFLARNGVQAVAALPAAATPPAPVDPNSPEARLQRARRAAAQGDVEGMSAALAGFPEEDARYDTCQRLTGGVDWLTASREVLASPAGSRLLAARQAFLAGDFEVAMDAILESVRADRGFQNGLARRAMLLAFAVFGEEREELDDYRRRLATLLY